MQLSWVRAKNVGGFSVSKGQPSICIRMHIVHINSSLQHTCFITAFADTLVWSLPWPTHMYKVEYNACLCTRTRTCVRKLKFVYNNPCLCACSPELALIVGRLMQYCLVSVQSHFCVVIFSACVTLRSLCVLHIILQNTGIESLSK